MNHIQANGVIIDGRSVILSNGKRIPFPKNAKGNNITIDNNRVIVDGYELIGDKWAKPSLADKLKQIINM